jgi:GNAT superfamily N-acetyltransferase
LRSPPQVKEGDFTIRYITLEDQASYRTLRSEALTTEPDAFGATLAALQAWSEAEWIDWLSQVIIPERKNIIVIELDKIPVATCGFGLSEDDPTSGFIWGMFVSPSHRKQQHGRALLKEAERWIRKMNRNRVKAYVAAPNETAITFYRRCGYIIGSASGVLRPGSMVPVYPIEKTLEN